MGTWQSQPLDCSRAINKRGELVTDDRNGPSSIGPGFYSPKVTERARPVPAEQTELSLTRVASIFRISRLTLLYYELRGLIRRRRTGRIRAYSWVDCDRISFITKSRRLGLSPSDVAPILRASDNLE